MLLDTDKIRGTRTKMRLTQAEAATAAGLADRRAWRAIESGQESNPTLECLARVAQVLGLTPRQIIKPDPISIKCQHELLTEFFEKEHNPEAKPDQMALDLMRFFSPLTFAFPGLHALEHYIATIHIRKSLEKDASGQNVQRLVTLYDIDRQRVNKLARSMAQGGIKQLRDEQEKRREKAPQKSEVVGAPEQWDEAGECLIGESE